MLPEVTYLNNGTESQTAENLVKEFGQASTKHFISMMATMIALVRQLCEFSPTVHQGWLSPMISGLWANINLLKLPVCCLNLLL